MSGRLSSSSRHDFKERQKRERRKERLEKQLHRMKEEEQEELKSGDDVRRRTSIGAINEIIGTKKLRSRMKKKKHQKVLRKLLAIEDHRTEEEEKEVENFRKLLKSENLLPARHDDYHTLLRFLRARKFDVEKSKLMWSNWMKWREEVDADHITQTFSFPEEDEVKSHYPSGHHGVDREGRPVYIELVGKADASKVLQHTSMERYVLFHICEFERTFQEKFPACSVASGKHINTTTTIMDVAGFGWKNFSKDARDLLGKITHIDGNYYPETLHKMYVINAGATFRAIWASIKPLLDPVTAAKIIVMGTNRDRLFEAVDPNELPAAIGGNCTCGGVEGGCFNSDRGPWKDPEIMKMVKVRQTGQYPDSGVDDLVNAAKRLHWITQSYRSDTESETDFSEVEDRGQSSFAPSDFDQLNPLPSGESLKHRSSVQLVSSGRRSSSDRPSRVIRPTVSISTISSTNSTMPSSEDEASGPRESIRMPINVRHIEPQVPSAASATKPSSNTSNSLVSRQPSIDAEKMKTVTVLAFVLAAFSKFYNVFQLFIGPGKPRLEARVVPASDSREQGYNGKAMVPPVQQIIKRVSKLEEKVVRLESQSGSSHSMVATDWPVDAKLRVRALEEELAETRRILTERQQAFEARLDCMRQNDTWSTFLCCMTQ